MSRESRGKYLSNKFADLPGFAIHDHTFNDIRQYVSVKISEETPRRVATGTIDDLQTLSDSITEKSQGVFIWVKLVIDEMITELCEEGSSIQVADLQNILLTMPSELEGLYERALSRLTRKLDRPAAAKARHESFIMFQIALCARSPIPLAYFINAASLLETGKGEYLEHDLNRRPKVSPKMILRLNSRCGGLLEQAIGQWYDSPNNRETVQFIHQTTEEFMAKKLERPEPLGIFIGVPYENGGLLFLHYCILVNLSEMDIRIVDFAYHALLVEKQLQKSNSRELDRLLPAGSANPLSRLKNFCNYLEFDKSFAQLCWKTQNPQTWLLLIAIYGGLFLFFQEKFDETIWSNKSYSQCLLRAMIYAILAKPSSDTALRFLDLLLSKGINPETPIDEETPLQLLLSREQIIGRLDVVNIISFLLQHGASPNQWKRGGRCTALSPPYPKLHRIWALMIQWACLYAIWLKHF